VDFRIQYKPRTGGPVLSAELFLQSVRRKIANCGCWETFGDCRMGAGPTVRVTALGGGRGQSLRSTAVWGSLTRTGEYSGESAHSFHQR
jgi:hypothetical protein